MNWRSSFGWRAFGAFTLFCAALAVWTWSGVLLVTKPMPLDEHVEYLMLLFQRGLLSYGPAFVLVCLADGLPLKGRVRTAALVAALVAGIAFTVQARCAVSQNQLFWVYSSVQIPYCSAFPTWRAYIDFPGTWLTPLGVAAMVMIFVFGRRREAELSERLRRTRAAQIESRRQRIESDLEAMQARVDPDALFGTLKAIRARYAESIDDGEALLEGLIARLRQAARHPSTEASGGY